MSAIKLCRLCVIPQGDERVWVKKATFYDDVRIALGSSPWSGGYREKVSFYMDGEPLEVGTIIAEEFIVVEIKESEVM